ncbi:MAG TPA: plastocyanin/azurin family copper-binding protein [Candidatus Limnocylindrales bacterium]|nr:plastocyanin/azurin family copper-binding protein [Candidatus Limnocylindrales bacterium]
MRRLLLPLATLGLLMGAFIGSAAPVAAGDPCFHDMSRPAVTEGNATFVKMDKCAFFPTVAHVPVGTEVQFINADTVGHEVVGANLTWGHHDKILGTDDQLGVRFASAGIYPYACMIHPGMTGAIIVGDALSAAAPAAPAAAAAVPGAAAAAGGTPAQEEPALTSSASFGFLPAVLGLAILTLVAVLGASLGMRRRRSNAGRPTA